MNAGERREQGGMSCIGDLRGRKPDGGVYQHWGGGEDRCVGVYQPLGRAETLRGHWGWGQGAC